MAKTKIPEGSTFSVIIGQQTKTCQQENIASNGSKLGIMIRCIARNQYGGWSAVPGACPAAQGHPQGIGPWSAVIRDSLFLMCGRLV